MTREKAISVTITLLRIAAGVMFLQAGGLKLFGWFGGMPPGVELSTLIIVAGWLEVIGGALITLGLFTRPTAFIVSGEMAVAYFIGHVFNGMNAGYWPIQNGGQPAVLYCFIFLFFAAYGAGVYSLDAYLKRRREQHPSPVQAI